MNSQQIRAELQMLTGVVTDDITYLTYLLLRDSKCYKEADKKTTMMNENQAVYDIGIDINTIEDWLSGLEEI